MRKICEMQDVRGGEDGFAVELWHDEETGRVVIVGFNEGGHSAVEIDFFDLIFWLDNNPWKKLLLDIAPDAISAGPHPKGDADGD